MIGRDLPAKEASLFKSVLKFYEHKQFKKGLKVVEQILKKFPDHGETLAMKGLFLNNMDKKEEAYDFVKKGLRNDLQSHICWHVFGLLYRSDKNYEEAMKCYVHALKYDKDNLQILRDYALLQVQMRNFEGFNEIRHRLLRLRPQHRPHWIGCAISNQLLNNHKNAIDILSAYEETLKEQFVGKKDFEHSEMLLYKNSLYFESGDYKGGLEHLISIHSQVCDILYWQERLALYYLKLENYIKSEDCYLDLIRRNPDSTEYYEGLLKSKQLFSDSNDVDSKKVREFLHTLQEEFPKSLVLKKLLLKYSEGEDFRVLASEYLKTMLRKGVPTLFVSMKEFYGNPEKKMIIEDLITNFAANLKSTSTMDGQIEEKEVPTVYLWSSYYIAQHLDFEGKYSKAIEVINEAIQHSPTLLELYMIKARIYKHCGDLEQAMKFMNEARELDLQDRFINSKCTKYMVRNDHVQESEKVISLFTRNDSGMSLNELIDMQCMWYTLECGLSHLRRKEYGRALKRFHLIEKHFMDFLDDQFDFHTYCVRKMTIRAYLDLLHLEDKIKEHHFFFDAATNAIKCYIYLHDNPPSLNKDGDDAAMAKLSEAEKRKLRNKQRKAELRNQAAPKKDEKTKDNDSAKVVDDDPNGEKYLKGNFLEEAAKFLFSLNEYCGDRIETQLLSAELNLHRKKFLLALRGLKKAKEMDSHHPELHVLIIKFKQEVDNFKDMDGVIKSLINEYFPKILEEKYLNNLIQFNADYLNQTLVTVGQVIGGLRGSSQLGKLDNQQSKAIISTFLEKQSSVLSLSDCQQLLQYVQFQLKDQELYGEVKSICIRQYPLATCF